MIHHCHLKYRIHVGPNWWRLWPWARHFTLTFLTWLKCKWVPGMTEMQISQVPDGFNPRFKEVYTPVQRQHQWPPSLYDVLTNVGGGPRVVVSTAAFHARVRGSVPGLGGLKETKLFLPHPRVKVSIVGSLRDREVACSASDRQGSNFESCVWRTVSS